MDYRLLCGVIRDLEGVTVPRCFERAPVPIPYDLQIVDRSKNRSVCKVESAFEGGVSVHGTRYQYSEMIRGKSVAFLATNRSVMEFS